MNWTQLSPERARGIDCRTRPDLQPPRNERGDPCPWPWLPQTKPPEPFAGFCCPGCGAYVLAGVEHFDYADAG